MWQKIVDFMVNVDWGVVTGGVALIFAAITLQVQRKHNRLSVKPIAIITIADYMDRLSVYLRNEGNGPLIIKDLSFTDDKGRKEKAIIDYFGTEFEGVVWSTFTGDIDGWAILPSEKINLIEFIGESTDKNFIVVREKVRKVLAPIKVELIYQDIYENEMPPKSRALDFFARETNNIPKRFMRVV